MRSRQIAERLGVEEAHMLEFQQFNIVWDKKTADYERNADDLMLGMTVSRTCRMEGGRLSVAACFTILTSSLCE